MHAGMLGWANIFAPSPLPFDAPEVYNRGGCTLKHCWEKISDPSMEALRMTDERHSADWDDDDGRWKVELRIYEDSCDDFFVYLDGLIWKGFVKDPQSTGMVWSTGIERMLLGQLVTWTCQVESNHWHLRALVMTIYHDGAGRVLVAMLGKPNNSPTTCDGLLAPIYHDFADGFLLGLPHHMFGCSTPNSC